MNRDSERAKQAIDALAVKRTTPRFELRMSVRIRRTDPNIGPLEELTVTENLGQGGAMVLTSLALMRGETLDFEEVGGHFRARAEVVDVTIGEDRLTRLNLRFLGERAAEGATEILRKAGLFPVSGRVTIESQTPLTCVTKGDIEQAIQGAFLGAAGSWTVTVSVETAFHPPWWILSVEGHEEFFRLSFRPAEQNPQIIHDHLREALRRRKLVA